MPKWAKRHYQKYHVDNESSSDDGDDIGNTVPYNDNIGDHERIGSSDSEGEELDGDPRAKRRENPFYQNLDDQVHFRNEEDLDLENDEFCGIGQYE